MKTTQEIYEAMRQAMAERAGVAPDESCELAVRLYAAAAQIESLYAYADWSRKQCFPQSASGEYLDLHAGLHGLTRDAAICARGTLIVGLDHVLDAPLTVPAGTRFCIPGGAFYRLDEDCRIPAGLVENEAAAVCQGQAAAVLNVDVAIVGQDARALHGDGRVDIKPHISRYRHRIGDEGIFIEVEIVVDVPCTQIGQVLRTVHDPVQGGLRALHELLAEI